jgi:DinB superfamily
MNRTKYFASAWLLATTFLAATAVAQTAPVAPPAATPGATSLTQQERDKALASLQATHDKFLQSISGLSEKQWKFKPGPDRWSIAEVSEHITIAESGIFGLVQQKIMQTPATPEKRASVVGKDDIILTKVPDRSVKAKAPEFLQPTGRFATPRMWSRPSSRRVASP